MHNRTRFLMITLGFGILLGIFTSFSQTFVPEPFKQLSNSYSVWLLFSFVVGYLLRSYKTAIIAGIIVQYLAILFYYISSLVRFDMPFTLGSLISLNLIWIIGGTLIGPLAAYAGVIVRKRAKYLSVAVAFVAGLFISEGFYQFLGLGYIGEGIIFVLIGLIFLTGMFIKTKFQIMKTMLWTVIFSELMYVGYAFVLPAVFA